MGWYDDGKRKIKHTHTPSDWDALAPQLEALGGAGTVLGYGLGHRLGDERGNLILDADKRPQTVAPFVWIVVVESEVSRMTTELATLLDG